jgi:hypothetical protein
MKRKIVIVVLAAAMLLGAVGSASADVRLDVDVPWLIAAGLNLQNITGSSGAVSVDLSSYHIPLPYIMLAYQFGDGFLRGGVGIRTYTVLVEFFGWPMGYVEASFDKLVLRAELGGLALFALGIENDLLTQGVPMISDFQVGYAFFPWLRVGAGVLVGAPISDLSSNVWAFYINARFTFDFK